MNNSRRDPRFDNHLNPWNQHDKGYWSYDDQGDTHTNNGRRSRKKSRNKSKWERPRSSSPSYKKKSYHNKEPKEIIEYLQTLHNKWLIEKRSINIKNLGLYLKKAVDGYLDCESPNHDKFINDMADDILDDDEKKDEEIKSQEAKPPPQHKKPESKTDINDGLVKFGLNIRKFCECYTYYLWEKNRECKNYEPEKFLRDRIEELKAHYEKFPKSIYICVETTNRLVHSVHYNHDASAPYLSEIEQIKLLRGLCEIAEYVEDKLGKEKR